MFTVAESMHKVPFKFKLLHRNKASLFRFTVFTSIDIATSNENLIVTFSTYHMSMEASYSVDPRRTSGGRYL